MPLLRHRRKKLSFRAPKFLRVFRRNTQAVSVPGNRVELFDQGGSFFPALLKAMREAREQIYLEFYIVRDDPVGRSLTDALINAVARGVEVFFIYDYIGCFDTHSSFFRRLEQGGVNCLPFNPPSFRRGIGWFDKRDHRKMTIIDGTSAFVGGINIGLE